MNFGYARVSAAGQNLGRQIEALHEAGVDNDRIFREEASGAKTDRPELMRMLTYLREGDTVYVCSFDRLARSTKQLLDLAEQFDRDKINLVSLKEKLDTSTPQGKLFFVISAAFSEFERAIIRERQAEGIALAKAQGRMKGRPRVDKDKLDAACALYATGEYSMPEIAKKVGCSYSTVYREVKNRGVERRDGS